MAKNFGYIRVSTREQNEDRQRVALSACPIPKRNLYMDKKSGADFDRPAYKRLVKRLAADDVLFILSIDRLGRNYAEILEQWRVITKEKGADVVVLDMPLLDTRLGKDLIGTFIADLVLQVLSFTAQNEREMIKSRQAQGIAAAKARGVKFGRFPQPLPDDFDALFAHWRDGTLTNEEFSQSCGMALGTVYRKIRERGISLTGKYRPRG